MYLLYCTYIIYTCIFHPNKQIELRVDLYIIYILFMFIRSEFGENSDIAVFCPHGPIIFYWPMIDRLYVCNTGDITKYTGLPFLKHTQKAIALHVSTFGCLLARYEGNSKSE
jgi:hypothetical protein